MVRGFLALDCLLSHFSSRFHRKKVGLNFWDNDPNNNNNNAVLRAKWGGSRLDTLYCDPSDKSKPCDPNKTGPQFSGSGSGSGSSFTAPHLGVLAAIVVVAIICL